MYDSGSKSWPTKAVGFSHGGYASIGSPNRSAADRGSVGGGVGGGGDRRSDILETYIYTLKKMKAFNN